MIRKIWEEIEGEVIDPIFDTASLAAWGAWCQEQIEAGDGGTYLKTEEWEKRFHCKPIENDSQDHWFGLIFENEASYMLFLLEWS